jgi:hypothetical protein
VPRWYRLLSQRRCSTLIAVNLGWMFDRYEAYAVVLSNGGRSPEDEPDDKCREESHADEEHVGAG